MFPSPAFCLFFFLCNILVLCHSSGNGTVFSPRNKCLFWIRGKSDKTIFLFCASGKCQNWKWQMSNRNQFILPHMTKNIVSTQKTLFNITEKQQLNSAVRLPPRLLRWWMFFVTAPSRYYIFILSFSGYLIFQKYWVRTWLWWRLGFLSQLEQLDWSWKQT